MMNIFTALVVEAFIVEIGTSKSAVEICVIEKMYEHENKQCQEAGYRTNGNNFQRDTLDGHADHDQDIEARYGGIYDVKLRYKKSTRFMATAHVQRWGRRYWKWEKIAR